MIDVNRLRVFRAVVAAGSVSAAADRLGYTPSAVSQQLSTLQRETGLVLFEKSGRGIVPTPAGRQLAHRSDELMSTLAKLDLDLDDLRSGRTGSLIIGSFGSAAEQWLPSVVATVLAEFQDTKLSVVLTDPPVSGVRADIDLVTEDPAEAPVVPVDAERIELTTEPYVVVLPREHELAGQQVVRVAQLAEHRWISDDIGENACSRITYRAWHSAGFVPKAVVQAADHHGAIAFVAAGVGVSVMPLLAALDLPPSVVRRPLVDPTPERRIAAILRHHASLHPAAARVIELLRSQIARSAA